MNLLLRAAAVAALVLPLAVAPAQSQDYRGAIGVYGGGFWSSDWNRSPNLRPANINNANTDFVRAERLRPNPGWIVGAQAEVWFAQGWVGARLNGAYTDRRLEFDRNGAALDDVNIWMGDADLLVRLARPRRDRRWAPFVSAGLGFINYNPAGSVGNILFPSASAFFPGDSETRFAGAFGIGTDILPAWAEHRRVPIGFRLELVDHIAFSSPLREVDWRFTDNLNPPPDSIWRGFEGDHFGAVHNVRFTAGIFAMLGRMFPAPVAVAPPPPPPAPPPAPPAPPPEEAITVCVIDPNEPGGLRHQEAVYLPETRDTMAVVNGDRVPLANAVARVPLATDASWYVAGQPLELTYAGEMTEFVTFGTRRVIEIEELAYLGTDNGMPVYAARRDVDPILQAQPGESLNQRLDTRDDVRRAFADVDVLYVPAETTNCVFIPLQRVEEVRKVRG